MSFWGTDYRWGSADIGVADTLRLVNGSVPAWSKADCTCSRAFVTDNNRLALTPELFTKLAWKYHDHKRFDYGLNGQNKSGESFPDCDDFRREANRNIVVDAPLREGWNQSIAFGGMSYYSNRLKGWHAANVVILHEPETGDTWMEVFEPQTQERYSMKEEIREVRWISI